MATLVNFRELWAASKRRHNFPEIYTETLKKFAGDETSSEMRSAQSCLGLGVGDFELELNKRCLPNIKRMEVIERDAASVAEFQTNLKQSLPNAKGVVHLTSLENFAGLETPVDVVAIIRFLGQTRAPLRRTLFHHLIEEWLTPGGHVVIVDNSHMDHPPHAAHIYSKLNPAYFLESYEDIRQDMLAVGFHLEREIEMWSYRDFSNPDDMLVKLHQDLVDNTVSEEQVRAAMKDLFPDDKTDSIATFAVFRKQTK